MSQQLSPADAAAAAMQRAIDLVQIIEGVSQGAISSDAAYEAFTAMLGRAEVDGINAANEVLGHIIEKSDGVVSTSALSALKIVHRRMQELSELYEAANAVEMRMLRSADTSRESEH